jgi:hypothetical protein
VLVVLAAIAFGAWYGNRQVWFLGTDDGGRVALYRGLPYELPFGVELYEERYAVPVQTSSLPQRRQDAVSGHDLRSREDAVSLIEDIEQSAEKKSAEERVAREKTTKEKGERHPSRNPPAADAEARTQGNRGQ